MRFSNKGVRILDLTSMIPDALNASRYDHHLNRSWVMITYQGVYKKAHKEELIKLGVEMCTRHGANAREAEQKIRARVYDQDVYGAGGKPRMHKRTGSWGSIVDYTNRDRAMWNIDIGGRGGQQLYALVPKVRFNLKELTS